jgi:hypothetical protein
MTLEMHEVSLILVFVIETGRLDFLRNMKNDIDRQSERSVAEVGWINSKFDSFISSSVRAGY